jgi:hypothetical protein
VDTDGDGLNDAAELELGSLGFDWQVPQADKVGAFLAGTAQVGLYTEAQLRALRPGSPLIKRQPDGKFSLSLDWKRSTDLLSWEDFPASPAGVSVDPSGDIRFEFEAGEDTEFFRVEMD